MSRKVDDLCKALLVGANNLLVLAAYVSESRPFEDSDIPQVTFARAVEAIDTMLQEAPGDVVRHGVAPVYFSSQRKHILVR